MRETTEAAKLIGAVIALAFAVIWSIIKELFASEDRSWLNDSEED